VQLSGVEGGVSADAIAVMLGLAGLVYGAFAALMFVAGWRMKQ